MIFTSYAQSKMLKDAGVELPVGQFDWYYDEPDEICCNRDNAFNSISTIRAFALDELMARDEWDIVIEKSGGYWIVGWSGNNYDQYLDLQSALDKCAELIAEQKGHPHA